MNTELRRLFAKLITLDPTTVEYRAVLDSIKVFVKELGAPISILQNFERTAPPTVEPAPSEPEPKAEPKKAAKAKKPDLKLVEKPELPTRDEVRELITGASRRGIQIRGIMSRHVPENKEVKFSNIPATEYPALMAEVKEALAEGETEDAE